MQIPDISEFAEFNDLNYVQEVKFNDCNLYIKMHCLMKNKLKSEEDYRKRKFELGSS